MVVCKRDVQKKSECRGSDFDIHTLNAFRANFIWIKYDCNAVNWISQQRIRLINFLGSTYMDTENRRTERVLNSLLAISLNYLRERGRPRDIRM